MKKRIIDILRYAISRKLSGQSIEDTLSPELYADLCGLNKGQQEAIAHLFLTKNKYSLLTGGAGTGKTHTVDVLVRLCYELGLNVLVTATTGKSAQVVKGKTIYRALEIDPERLLLGIVSNTAPDEFNEADLIIVDEVSMMTRRLFEKALSKYVKGNKKVLFCGDGLQLPPVEEPVYTRYDRFMSKFFAYVGRKMEILYLDEIVRQDDEEFIMYLNEARFGIFNPELNEKLGKEWYVTRKDSEGLRKIAAYILEKLNEGRQVKYLAAVKELVEKVNALCLELLGCKEDEMKVYDVVVDPCKDLNRVNEEDREKVEALIRKMSEKEGKEKDQDEDKDMEFNAVRLYPGQLVMITQNQRVHRREKPKYVNGSDGVVTGLYDDRVDVKLKNGEVVSIEYVKKPLHITYTGADGKVHTFTYKTVSYLPLISGYACTIHKSQGLTLDEVFLDPRRCSAPGQMYTGLSRVRRIEDIHLVAPIQKKNVVADVDCIVFYHYIADYGVGYGDVELSMLEGRFKAVDLYNSVAEKVKRYLDNDMPEYITDKDRVSFEVEKSDEGRLGMRISEMVMFNEYYSDYDIPDPRLPFYVIDRIRRWNEKILTDWVYGVYDSCLDPETYGLPLLALPEIPITKGDAYDYLSDLWAYGDTEDTVYDEETIADFKESSEEDMDKYFLFIA